MKLRSLLDLQAGPKAYDFRIVDLDLPKEGRISYAHWLHPRENVKHPVMEQDCVDKYRQFLSPGDAAIDVGARTGDTTLSMAIAAGVSGAVFALEPNPYAFEVLRETARLNREKTNIIPLPFAAMPADGEFDFRYTDPGFHNGGYSANIPLWRHGRSFKLRVQGRNLLAYLRAHHPEALQKVRLIKVDTEGYDHVVLATLAELIQQRRPVIQAEMFKYTGTAQRKEFLRFLTGLGYRVLIDDSERIGPELTFDNLTAIKSSFDLLCLPKEKR